MFGLLQSQADGPSHVVLTQNDVTAVWVLIAMLVAFFLPNTFQLTRDFRPIWKTVLGAVCFGAACLAMLASESQVFLYFNF